MDKYERFVASYLRLNGYFTVPNFIVHAADDPARIYQGRVGNYTETDILAVRMPHSSEQTGALKIANDPALTVGAGGRFDVVIAEVKSGKDNKPNSVWCGQAAPTVAAYIARFVGLDDDPELTEIAAALASGFAFENDIVRYRFIVFADERNSHYFGRGVTYITFDAAISFVVGVRGQCWIDANIGVASSHHQWDELLVQVFEIANRSGESVADRVCKIRQLLAA